MSCENQELAYLRLKRSRVRFTYISLIKKYYSGFFLYAEVASIIALQ